MTLDKLGRKHSTDQSSLFHGYLDRYEPLFEKWRQEPVAFVEIGIAGGNSLRAWAEYFTNATIIGIDHNRAVEKLLLPPNVHVVCGDAVEAVTWEKVRAAAGGLPIAIINDDGGHFTHHILGAFIHAWPMLANGGLYCVQDLHQIYIAERGDTFLDWLKVRIDVVNENGAGQCAERQTVNDIESMTLSKSLAILRKSK